jgi:amino acid transporter
MSVSTKKKGSNGDGDLAGLSSKNGKSSKGGSLYRLDSVSRFKLGLSKYDLVVYLLNLSIAGFFVHWNQGLKSGFVSFIIAVFVVGSAAVCNGVNSNELTTAFPYSGSIFGFSRVTLGYYVAYLAACCEIMAAILFFSITSMTLGKIVTSMDPVGWKHTMEPIVWVVYTSLMSFLCVYGGKYVFSLQKCLCCVSLIIFLVYCLGSLKYVDFRKNAPYHDVNGTETGVSRWFADGIGGFLYVVPLAFWFFQAIPSVAVTADDSDDPKTSFAFATNLVILLLVIMTIMVVFVFTSLPSEDSSSNAYDLTPLTAGFQLMFNSSSKLFIILTVPAVLTSGFGFIFTYSKLLYSLAQSKLLSRWLQRRDSKTGVPYVAVFFGAVASFCCCLLAFYMENVWNQSQKIHHFKAMSLLFNLAVLSCLVVYSVQCICYVFLQRKFRNLTRTYNSPFGICGSVYACCIWAICLVAVVGFQRDGHSSVIVFLIIIAVVSIYYRGYAKDSQMISKQETKVLFTAHVINCKFFFRHRSAPLIHCLSV